VTVMRYITAGGAATCVIFLFVTSGGAAPAKLTDFNGSWNGIGTDRASPLEVSQPTSCHASIRADETTLNDEIICEGKAGLHKTISLTLHLSDSRISGTLTQTSTTRDSEASPTTLQGSVSGTRTDNAANFQVRFGGLMPTAMVALTLNSQSSFFMQASTFVGTLMEVNFDRAGSR
jgi:hypothetical protein